jgi:hypothetical protein
MIILHELGTVWKQLLPETSMTFLFFNNEMNCLAERISLGEVSGWRPSTSAPD